MDSEFLILSMSCGDCERETFVVPPCTDWDSHGPMRFKAILPCAYLGGLPFATNVSRVVQDARCDPSAHTATQNPIRCVNLLHRGSYTRQLLTRNWHRRMAGVLVINGITSSDNLKTQSDSLYQDVEKSYDNWRQARMQNMGMSGAPIAVANWTLDGDFAEDTIPDFSACEEVYVFGHGQRGGKIFTGSLSTGSFSIELEDVGFLAKLLSTLKWPGGKRITLVMCNSTDLAQQLSGKYSGTVVGCDFPTGWSSPDGQSIYTKMPQAGKDTTKALQTFKAGQMEDATGEGLIVV